MLGLELRQRSERARHRAAPRSPRPTTPFGRRPRRTASSASGSAPAWRRAPTSSTRRSRFCNPASIAPRPLPRCGSPKRGSPAPRAGNAMNAISVVDLTRRFGDFVAVDHLTFDVKARRDLRLPRQQRRRQIDDDQNAVRAAEADERHRDGRWPGRRPRSRRGQAPHRLHVPALLPLRAAHGRSEHPLLRRSLRPRGRTVRGAARLRAGHGRLARSRADARHRSRGRLASAARARLRHSARAADRVSRRADRRRRSAVAAAVLVAHRHPLVSRASRCW